MNIYGCQTTQRLTLTEKMFPIWPVLMTTFFLYLKGSQIIADRSSDPDARRLEKGKKKTGTFPVEKYTQIIEDHTEILVRWDISTDTTEAVKKGEVPV